MADDIDLQGQSGDADGTKKPSMRGKIQAIGFIAIVIVVECLVAYLYIPSSAETAAMASATLGIDPDTGDLKENPYDKQDDLDNPDIETAEVDLGQFSVTAFQPVSNTTLRIDFQLFGTIALADEEEFIRLMEQNRHRFREAVIVTIRGADVTDFTEAQLGLIKRKVLEKTNRILGKPLLRNVIFSQFSFIEQ
jgi:flagellar FliL protein